MEIDDRFNFGKYRGYSLREVYQGMDQIENALIKEYILDKVLGEYRNIIDFPVLAEIIKLELSETLIRVKSNVDDTNGFWKNKLEGVLRNGNTRYDRMIGNISLDRLSNLKNFEDDEYSLFREGSPGYIEWCIKNIDYFSIEPDDLMRLQTLDVFCFLGIEISYKIEDIYEYKPILIAIKHQFSPEIIEINRNKSN